MKPAPPVSETQRFFFALVFLPAFAPVFLLAFFFAGAARLVAADFFLPAAFFPFDFPAADFFATAFALPFAAAFPAAFFAVLPLPLTLLRAAAFAGGAFFAAAFGLASQPCPTPPLLRLRRSGFACGPGGCLLRRLRGRRGLVVGHRRYRLRRGSAQPFQAWALSASSVPSPVWLRAPTRHPQPPPLWPAHARQTAPRRDPAPARPSFLPALREVRSARDRPRLSQRQPPCRRPRRRCSRASSGHPSYR